jgi:hypothetical protein
VVIVGLSIILFEVFPEKGVWSIPVRQEDCCSGFRRFTLLLMQTQEAYKTITENSNDFGREY